MLSKEFVTQVTEDPNESKGDQTIASYWSGIRFYYNEYYRNNTNKPGATAVSGMTERQEIYSYQS